MNIINGFEKSFETSDLSDLGIVSMTAIAIGVLAVISQVLDVRDRLAWVIGR